MQIAHYMRRGMIAILFLLNAVPTLAQSQFFPKRIFAEKGAAETSTVTWYSRALKNLDEPSLWELSQNNKHAVAYRFLWLRSFHHPVAIRLMIAPDGTAAVITKVSNGVAGYDPGRLIENHTEKLSAIEVKHLFDQMNSAHFWELPTEEKKKNTSI